MSLISPVLAILALLQPPSINKSSDPKCAELGHLVGDALEMTKSRLNYYIELQTNYINPEEDKRSVAFVPMFRTNPNDYSGALLAKDIQRLTISHVLQDDGKLADVQQILDENYECIPAKYRCNKMKIKCDPNQRFRSFNGSCNNLRYPYFGMAGTSYESDPVLLDDGVDSQRLDFITRQSVISPRYVGQYIQNNLQEDPIPNNIRLPNQFSLFMGQAFSHEIGGNQQVVGVGDRPVALQCCAKNRQFQFSPSARTSDCSPIAVPFNDKFFASQNVECFNYVHLETVVPFNCSDTRPLLSKNRVTPCSDLDILYSRSEETAKKLRTGSGGKLRSDAGGLPGERCNGKCCESISAGDTRSNQTGQLLFIHSMFATLHNNITDLYKSENPNLYDEDLFNLARALCIDIFSSIMFNYWLPTFVDKKYLRKVGLFCPNSEFVGGCESRYDPNVKIAAEAETSHAALRTFHNYLQGTTNFRDENWNIVSSLELPKTFLNVKLLCFNQTQMVRGMIGDEIRLSSKMITQLTDGLFGSLDLFSIDIMRGRDHGLRSYPYYYKQSTGKEITNFNDLIPVFGSDKTKILEHIYKHVQNIDLLEGMAMEIPQHGLSGPVKSHLLARQFQRLKSGDRLFYTHRLTTAQIYEIQSLTPSRLLCIVHPQIQRVPENVFLSYKPGDKCIDCNDMPKFDISKFLNV